MEEVGKQPHVDAVLTGRFPANSRVAPEDLTSVDLHSGPFFDALLQAGIRPLPARFFFFLEHVLSVYFSC